MPSHTPEGAALDRGASRFSPSYQVEAQLDAMLSPIVQLRSGGYIVINQTEALVAIDVNSGRATRERNIEDTALAPISKPPRKSPSSCACATWPGLIVIDFIDMESRKNNRAVEASSRIR